MKTIEILLLEDDHVDVESVKRALNKIKITYTLHVAHNGVDALAMLTGNYEGITKIDPSVILFDLNMPKMNGFEFLGIVKNYYSLAGIKIFVLTTSAEEYDRIAAQNLNADGYIVKPLDFQNKRSEDIQKLLRLLSTADN